MAATGERIDAPRHTCCCIFHTPQPWPKASYWGVDMNEDLLKSLLKEIVSTEVGALRTEIGDQFKEVRTEMNEQFKEVRAEMNERFAKVDERFDKVDERFNKIDKQFVLNEETQNEILNAIGEDHLDYQRTLKAHADILDEHTQAIAQLKRRAA